MKKLKYTLLILLTGLLSTSCGEEAKKLKDDINNTKNVVETAVKVASEGEGMKKNILSLRTKTPLTQAQWESWLPEKLLELPLSNPQLNFMPGIASCGANYKIGNKRIRVMVIDGAGEKGAGAVGPYRMSSKMDYNTEDTWGYTKTRTINGVKAKESYRKSANSYAVSMFYADRFAVDIETYNLEQAELEQIIKELNLDKLSDL